MSKSLPPLLWVIVKLAKTWISGQLSFADPQKLGWPPPRPSYLPPRPLLPPSLSWNPHTILTTSLTQCPTLPFLFTSHSTIKTLPWFSICTSTICMSLSLYTIHFYVNIHVTHLWVWFLLDFWRSSVIVLHFFCRSESSNIKNEFWSINI